MKISIDTRTIQSGDTFIPIKGDNFDGHDFISTAIQKGAQVLDVDIAQYAKKYRKKLKCPIIAVTGSAGKTTVKDLLFAVLSQRFNVHKTHQNENNEIGVPLTLLRADFQTEILIVEMGMRHRGDISYLTQIVRPTHVVITGIGLSHIEILKTKRAIALAKAEIFRKALSWEKPSRMAFLNYSSAYYGLVKDKADQAGYTVFPFKGDELPEQNISLCYLVGRQFGLTDDEIQAGLASYQASSHRLQVAVGEITLLDDTYNANPDGTRYALNYLKRYAGRKILVFGDMLELGRFAKKEHQAVIAEAINADVSIVFTYGDLCKNMKSEEIQIYHFDDKETLHQQLSLELKSKDVVLVKGSRGMKMDETVQFLKQRGFV